MQIVERSAFGIRSARLLLKADRLPDFVLFPMLHLADAEFYDLVISKAESCDVILAEGVKSPSADKLTGYNRLAANPKLGVVRQKDIFQSIVGRTKWRNSDVSSEEFETAIRKVPMGKNLYLRFAFCVGQWLFRERDDLIASIKSIEDTDYELSKMTESRLTFGDDLHEVIHDARDQRLAEFADEAIGESHERIGVVWGASHMPRLIRHLRSSHGYQVGDAKWMWVMRR